MHQNYEDLESEFELYSAMITIWETFQEIYEIMAVDMGEIGRKIVSVIDATKKLTDLAIATKNVELRESTVELRDQLVDIKEALVKVKEENFELREEIKKLQQPLPQAPKLFLEGKFYYKENDQRPFCPVCYDSIDKKISSLVLTPVGYGHRFKCVICDSTHLLDEHVIEKSNTKKTNQEDNLTPLG